MVKLRYRCHDYSRCSSVLSGNQIFIVNLITGHISPRKQSLEVTQTEKVQDFFRENAKLARVWIQNVTDSFDVLLTPHFRYCVVLALISNRLAFRFQV